MWKLNQQPGSATVWVVKPTHVAPIVAEVLSPIVNDVVGVAASPSPVSVSVAAEGAIKRIPTVVDIKKKAGIDGAASLKKLDSDDDKPDLGAKPITLPTEEEFADGLNQELILQVSPPKKKGRVAVRVFRYLCKQWLKVLLVLLVRGGVIKCLPLKHSR
ncbi:hypothetical protein RHMOL_Rhmol02G0175900 [Rhododendron molle]|uniref:Uncharacterized protein n=1 Tax=Rhododendron molle TaxID=49168 RepID=A0ACC0PSM7_RHOML|nr:hypothetical protein RHMOL_Rhmol02G0175900 [Rhododendron molle]